MNEKEKQIEEMAYSICNLPEMYGITKSCSTCGNKGRCKPQWKAEKLYAAGYRKASDVIDEFVERLKEENEISFRRYGKGIGISTIFRIADEMRQEVEK